MHGKAKYFLAALTFFFTVVFLGKNTYALIAIESKINPTVVQSLSCVMLANTYDEKISAITSSKTKHLDTYIRLSDRLEQMLDKWKAWGYDVSKIEEDLDKLNDKVSEFEEDFNDFTSKIMAAKAACGSSVYDQKLTDARNALKELKNDSADIRSFYQNSIRKHIVEMKGQNL